VSGFYFSDGEFESDNIDVEIERDRMMSIQRCSGDSDEEGVREGC